MISIFWKVEQIKMISVQHSSNNGKNLVPRKTSWHVIILNPVNKKLSKLKLSSWPRERKLNLKLFIFQLKERFASVKNTTTHVLSILIMFDIKFLENAWELNRGVTSRNELKWLVLDSIPKVAVLWVDF